MKIKTYLLLTTSLAFIVSGVGAASAQNFNGWTGDYVYDTGVDWGTNNYWDAAANWGNNVTPTGADDVHIGTGVDISGYGLGSNDTVIIRDGVGGAVAGTITIGSAGVVGDADTFGPGHLTNQGQLTVGSGIIVGDSYGGTFVNNGDLDLSGGSLVVARNAQGSVTIGADATTDIDGHLVVGEGASGSLVANSDIDVQGNTTIGQHTNSDGSLTLTNGAHLSTDGGLAVGESGSGALIIDFNSRAETAGAVVVGQNSTSRDNLVVVGGEMDNGQTLTIGQSGSGMIEVSDTGAVNNSGRVVLGSAANAQGALDNNGAVTNQQDLVVGENGVGVVVTSGANATTTTSGNVTLGDHRNSLGLAIVRQGEMTTEGRFDVGHDGEGYLLVADSGVARNGAAVMAREEGSRGFAVVTGDDSRWENDTLTVAEDDDSLAVLVINDGGTVSVGGGNGTLVLAADEGSRGVLNIGAHSPVGEDYGLDSRISAELAGADIDSDAREEGFLEAEFVQFGDGEGTVNFSTTSSIFDDYHFQAGFVGEGVVNHYAGFTVLDGDSSGFTGDANVIGGTLVANNELAGDVTVGASGTLHIGHGGTTGDVVNDITNDGRVIFNRSDDYVFDSVIGGTGDVVQIGSGTTIVTADQTYEGGTRIWNGTLQLGNGGTTGSLGTSEPVFVGWGGELAFNRSDLFLFDQELVGAGTISQIGTGITVLTTDSENFFGHANVENGVLALADIAFGGSVDIEDGAALIGYGSVDETTVESGGVISPGAFANLGMLTVTDDFTQHEGATYFAKLHTDGASDLIAVLDDARIADGAVLRVATVGGGRHELEHRYTVLTAGDELEGEYDIVGDLDVSTFYRLTDTYDYDAGEVYVDVAQHRLFGEAALTPNQTAAANAAQELKAERSVEGTPTNNLFRAIAYLPTDELAQFAFDQISGEIYASTTIGLIEHSRFTRDASGQRIRDVFGDTGAASVNDGLAIWGQGFGSWSEVKGDGNAGTFSHNTGGFFIGGDLPVTDLFRVGVLGGYSQSSFGSEARGSSATSDNFDLGIYGGGEIENFGFRLGANYTWHRIETDRNVNFPDFSDSLSSGFDARTTQIYGDIGYTIDMGDVSFEPFAGLAYVNVDRDGYGETGGVAALSGGSDVVDATFATLGLRGSALLSAGDMPVKATGMIGWRHAFDPLTPTVTHSFAGSSAFTVSGVPLAQDVAVVEAGLETLLSEELTAGVSYGGQFGSGISDHGVRGTLNWKF